MSNNGIPKIVHYIWFGKGEKSELIKKCMSTAYEKLDGWEFKEWTEDNYDITKCDYLKEAYDNKKYAFASDYARFDLLYRFGGVYLDTDVELIRSIPDSMLSGIGFAGMESNNKIAPGLIFACEAGNKIVKEILDVYEAEHFILPDGKLNYKTVVERVNDIFVSHGYKQDGTEQIVDGFHIYPPEFFCAYDFVTNQFTVTDKTISIHHYTATWASGKSKLKLKMQGFFRSLLGIEGYKKLISIKRKIFGVNGE